MTRIDMRCRTCGTEEPSAFYASSKHQSENCISCTRDYNKAYYAANPQREKERVARWRAENPEAERAMIYKSRYGITLAEYEQMNADQDGLCAICSEPPADGPLLVDHDHSCCPKGGSCGQCIRGLVCHTCNIRVLPVVESGLVDNAIKYLESYLTKRGVL